MSDFKFLDFNLTGHIAQIVMRKPPSNIIDFAMMSELSAALDESKDASFLVLSSSMNSFSTGVDVGIHLPELIRPMLARFHAVIRKLYHFPGLSICGVHGITLGGGMEMALVCDFILAEGDSQIGFPEIRLACFPPVASILLPRLVGRAANHILFTGQPLSATRAFELGLADAVYKKENKAAFHESLLADLSSLSRSALRTLKSLLRRDPSFDFDAQLDRAEKTYLEELLASPDTAEGIKAFLEKRPPNYTS
jgi:cyclohexa-1,5-dienecarbonyl-CoA hydratase